MCGGGGGSNDTVWLSSVAVTGLLFGYFGNQVGSQNQVFLSNPLPPGGHQGATEFCVHCPCDEVHFPGIQPIFREWRLIGNTSNEDRYKKFVCNARDGPLVFGNPRSFVGNLGEICPPIYALDRRLTGFFQVLAKCLGIVFRFGRNLCLAQKLNQNSRIQRCIQP